MASVQDVGNRDFEALEFVHRQIDAPAPCIFADVADDVGQLEGHAEVVRVLQCLAVLETEDLCGEQANDAGDAVAIERQCLEVEVARLLQIHLHAVDDLQELLLWDGKLCNDGQQRLRYRMLRLAGIELGDFLPPPGELGARNLQVLALIDDVVDLPAKGVERGDRPPPVRGQEHEAVVEARSARSGLLLAVFFRSHLVRLFRKPRFSHSSHMSNERPPMSNQSVGPRRGRCRNTSPLTRCMRSRMRSPP